MAPDEFAAAVEEERAADEPPASHFSAGLQRAVRPGGRMVRRPGWTAEPPRWPTTSAWSGVPCPTGCRTWADYRP